MKKSNFSYLTDEQLASLGASGDKNAMDFLLEKHRGLVRAIAREFFLFGGDTDDVMQEGMIGLFKAVRDFDIEKSVSFLFFARLCIKRQIMSAVTAANRQKNIPLNTALSFHAADDVSLIGDLSDEGLGNPEAILIEKEKSSVFNEAILSNLSRFEQKVLSLYLEGKTYIEISEELDKEPKSIDNAIQRIKRKLASLI